ncbi:MAG: glycosyl transferase [Lachnospiraceae bacterium]|nr:glycosyl transferase [Lachnospiraceae bacterium]
MNFNYNNVIKKHKRLDAAPVKIATKVLVYGLRGIIIAFIAAIAIVGFMGLGVLRGIIDNAPEEINIAPVGFQTTIYDTNGNLIETLETSGSNRSDVSIAEIPEHLQWAFIDVEDARFYQHNGIDVKGIIRAGLSFVTTGSFSGGGASTITQQLLKNNVFENGGAESNKGALIRRKIQEQYLALKVEQTYTKDIILQHYLNTINLGAGCYGVNSAAKRYFNKELSALTISESAVIAAITQNPRYLNPINYPEANGKRRAKILKNMFENGHISKTEYDEAVNDDVYSRISDVNIEYTESETAYSYFVDELIDQVIADLMDKKNYNYTQALNAVYSGGLQIYSTQDSGIQSICDEELSNDANYPKDISYSFDWAWSVQHADGTVDNYSNVNITYYNKVLLGNQTFKIIFDSKEEAQECIDKFKEEYLKDDDIILGESLIFSPQPQASFTVIDQHNGYVKAIVGGRGEKLTSRSLNRATSTVRQPGSTFKVLAVYAPAIDRLNYSLATVEDDAPFNDINGRPISNWWESGEYRGLCSLRQAIYQSMNIIAVKTITQTTPQLGYEYLMDFGFTSLVEDTDQYIQSLALGGISKGVSNIELCAAYASIANNGVYTKPIYYTKILDNNGRIVLENEAETHTVLKESTAFLLTSAMHDVVTTGTGKACNVKTQYIAGKTGTTSNSNDVWFAGYSTHLTATIWCGYDENAEIESTFQKKLWGKVMTRIHDELGYSTVSDPEQYEINMAKKLDSITEVKVCKKSGLLPVEGLCDLDPQGSMVVSEYFAVGTEPTETCNCHISVKICNVSGKIANAFCPVESTTEKIYRLRMLGTEGETLDTPYTITDALLNSRCIIHHG